MRTLAVHLGVIIFNFRHGSVRQNYSVPNNKPTLYFKRCFMHSAKQTYLISKAEWKQKAPSLSAVSIFACAPHILLSVCVWPGAVYQNHSNMCYTVKRWAWRISHYCQSVDVAFIIFRNSAFQSCEAKVESDALSDRLMYKTEIQKKLSIFMHWFKFWTQCCSPPNAIQWCQCVGLDKGIKDV